MKREEANAGGGSGAVGDGLTRGSAMDVVKEPKKNNNIREIRTIR